jgi:hypothetical protein
MALIGWKKKNTVSEAEKKEAIRNIFGEEGEYNKFYDTVSAVYRVAEFALLAAFLLFIIYSAIANAGNITYEKFDYIIRNFAVSLDQNSDFTSSIFYNPDEDAAFSLFGGGLAVCTGSEVEIFSATGRKTCSERHGYVSPVLVASDKYVIVYEENGTEYSVYNTFSKVHSETLEHPIKGISVSKDGYYAIITRTDEYIGAVELYDSSFNQVNRYLKNDHILSVDISDDAKIAIASLGVDKEGNFSTEIMLSAIGETKAIAAETFSAGLPLRCEFTKSGLMLTCADRVVFIDENLSKTNEYFYPSGEVVKLESSAEAVLVIVKGNAMKKENSAVVINSSGQVAQTLTSGTVISVDLFESNGYVLTENGLFTLGEGLSAYKELETVLPSDTVIAYDTDRLYYCGASSAKVIKTQ